MDGTVVAGISTVAGGVSALATALLGFWFKRELSHVDSKVSRAEHDALRVSHDALVAKCERLREECAELAKLCAVMGAENEGRDEKLDDLKDVAKSMDQKLDTLLMRTPARGLPATRRQGSSHDG